MSPSSTYGVFISYSHEDAKLVTPLVRLLRYERNDLIFHDKNDIRDGEQWEPQLLQRLGEVHTVMVFWCKHSAESEYVRKEYLQGIAQQKKILPIILDETKMTKELAAYQGIDFRDSAIHPSAIANPSAQYPPSYESPAPMSAPPYPPTPKKSYRSPNTFIVFTVVLCVMVILFILLTALPWWIDVLIALVPAFIILRYIIKAVRNLAPLARKKEEKVIEDVIKDEWVIKRLDKQIQDAKIFPDFPRPLADQILRRLNEMIPAS